MSGTGCEDLKGEYFGFRLVVLVFVARAAKRALLGGRSTMSISCHLISEQ